MSQGLTGDELESLLEDHPTEAKRLLDDIHPEDLADVVDDLTDDRAGELLMQLPPEFAAQVFERLDEEQQGGVAEAIGVEETAKLVVNMGADELADFISIMPPAMTEPLLQQLESADPGVTQDVEELRRWPDTSAGGLMTTDYIRVEPHWSVRQAIQAVRESAVDAETLEALYALDERGHLLGVATLRRLLLAGADESVDSVMLRKFKSVLPDLDQEDVARTLAKYDLLAMPVVDSEGKLLGVITADDVLHVLVAEQSEDVAKMSAMEPLVAGYLDTSLLEFFRKRLPWLLMLFFAGFLTTQALQSFNKEISAVTQLAFYLPLLISAGGNSGAQSSTLVIRGIALREVKGEDWLRVLSRELVLGLSMGCVLAFFGVSRALLVGDGLDFALLVGVTVVAIVLLGCVVGGMAPLLLRRLGIDPATSSTPLIASLVDVLGIVVYLSLARLLLSALSGAQFSP
jgi:magnesium transporter